MENYQKKHLADSSGGAQVQEKHVCLRCFLTEKHLIISLEMDAMFVILFL